jgi:hypothetical protein
VKTAIWVHDAALSATDVSIRSDPDAALIFVFDEERLRTHPMAYHRLRFIFDGVADLYANVPHAVKEVHRGATVAEVLAFCQKHRRTQLLVTDSADPYTRLIIEKLKERMPVTVLPRDVLVECPVYLKRFSRYWDKYASNILGYAPAAKRKMH